ncbi:hypothetical protein HY224_03420 [Candidatus Uhrbacteria bacterium]|nr:hypothetical protein [Candidatus Uhrbacteria bacterium]
MITISVLFIPYGLFLLIMGIFALFNFYHVFKYGFGDVKLFVGTFIFICAFAIILFYSWQLFRTLDWTAPLIDFRNLLKSNANPFIIR